jgi:hypothetical protein
VGQCKALALPSQAGALVAILGVLILLVLVLPVRLNVLAFVLLVGFVVVVRLELG